MTERSFKDIADEYFAEKTGTLYKGEKPAFEKGIILPGVKFGKSKAEVDWEEKAKERVGTLAPTQGTRTTFQDTRSKTQKFLEDNVVEPSIDTWQTTLNDINTAVSVFSGKGVEQPKEYREMLTHLDPNYEQSKGLVGTFTRKAVSGLSAVIPTIAAPVPAVTAFGLAGAGSMYKMLQDEGIDEEHSKAGAIINGALNSAFMFALGKTGANALTGTVKDAIKGVASNFATQSVGSLTMGGATQMLLESMKAVSGQLEGNEYKDSTLRVLKSAGQSFMDWLPASIVLSSAHGAIALKKTALKQIDDALTLHGGRPDHAMSKPFTQEMEILIDDNKIIQAGRKQVTERQKGDYTLIEKGFDILKEKSKISKIEEIKKGLSEVYPVETMPFSDIEKHTPTQIRMRNNADYINALADQALNVRANIEYMKQREQAGEKFGDEFLNEHRKLKSLDDELNKAREAHVDLTKVSEQEYAGARTEVLLEKSPLIESIKKSVDKIYIPERIRSDWEPIINSKLRNMFTTDKEKGFSPDQVVEIMKDGGESPFGINTENDLFTALDDAIMKEKSMRPADVKKRSLDKAMDYKEEESSIYNSAREKLSAYDKKDLKDMMHDPDSIIKSIIESDNLNVSVQDVRTIAKQLLAQPKKVAMGEAWENAKDLQSESKGILVQGNAREGVRSFGDFTAGLRKGVEKRNSSELEKFDKMIEIIKTGSPKEDVPKAKEYFSNLQEYKDYIAEARPSVKKKEHVEEKESTKTEHKKETKLRLSRLSKRAYERGLVDEMTEYQAINLAKNTEEALRVLSTDKEKAIRIARGEEGSDVQKATMIKAMMESQSLVNAENRIDRGILTDIVNNASPDYTEMGQVIVSLRSDPYDTFKLIRSVIRNRTNKRFKTENETTGDALKIKKDKLSEMLKDANSYIEPEMRKRAIKLIKEITC